VLVDDRRAPASPLAVPSCRHSTVVVTRSAGRGPAAARNAGVTITSAPWLVFLDDDVVPTTTWTRDLERDLDGAADETVGVQGRIVVPLPRRRRPTDWERNVAGLEHARYATADMAYRRAPLVAADGFDERFPRAYREDADLAVRLLARRPGTRIMQGARTVVHPVRPAPWHVSLTKQRGNADDALMARLHGREWRARAGAPAGRRRSHLLTTAAGAAALVAAATKHDTAARAAGVAWATSTAAFAYRRAVAGPRTAGELAAMAMTSIAIPPAASFAWLTGLGRARRLTARPPARARRSQPAVDAVLFDRDGTLVVDVPYNADPARVQPMPGARDVLDQLRAAGVRVGVVTNQSGIARGVLTEADVEAVHARLHELLGPFDTVCVCPHGPGDACRCRKPAPGLVLDAARRLGVAPHRCLVVGDIGADIDAALAAGALGVLVPTAATRAEETARAQLVMPELGFVADFVLHRRERAA
jgi:histidinol-phosphate phosphatase family protein